MFWLRGLGLESYEAAFRENAIDETGRSAVSCGAAAVAAPVEGLAVSDCAQ